MNGVASQDEAPGEGAGEGAFQGPPDGAVQAIADLDNAARRSEIAAGEGFATWREWGDGPVLVLLHGGAGSWKHFFRQIGFLARDHRVIAVDLPGFGDSAQSNPQADPEAMAQILAAGIDELVGAERFHLVGFSYGGIIGGYLARLMPSRVIGFVLVGAVGFEARHHAITLSRWRHLEEIDARREIHRKNLAAIMIADPDRIDDTAIMIQESNAERSRHDSRRVARMKPLTGVLDESDVPLAAIWGARDHLAVTHFDERRAWLAERDPQAPFVLVPDAGHWVQYEAPDAFNEALAECLSSFGGRRRRPRRSFQGG
jgi:pimeloyl-ACP methyl ester carboxylesterase